MTTEPARERSFLGNVNIVMLTYAADGLLALATGALVARALGADGRGAYALFVVSAAFGQLLLGLGIGNAALYYLNKRELSVKDVLGVVHFVVLASVAITAAVVAVIAPIDTNFGSIGGHEIGFTGESIFGAGISPWLLVASVPVLLYMSLLRLVLQAQSRFVDLGVATVGQQSALLALVAFAFATGDPDGTDVVLFLLAGSGAAAIYALARIGFSQVDLAWLVRPRFGVIRRLARWGVQGEIGNVLQLANYRLDQYIVRDFVSLTAVGVYAVGTSMTEAVFILSNAVALVLLPRLTSADPEEAARLAPVASRNTMLIATCGALALAAVAPLLIPAVFGDAFEDSVQALWLLLPGTVALAGSKVLTSYIFSQGRPLVNTGITVVSLVVTVVADLALIPRFGVNGAATASSLAYVAHFAAALFAYNRLSGRPALAAVLPRREDAALYTGAVRALIARRSSSGRVGAGSETGARP
ncbi:MAG: oligosaccharide flippase family protein [Dehalococcoidia bacterium]